MLARALSIANSAPHAPSWISPQLNLPKGQGQQTLGRPDRGPGGPVGLEISMRVQMALEELGVEFLPETESHGPAMRVRNGVVKKIGFQ